MRDVRDIIIARIVALGISRKEVERRTGLAQSTICSHLIGRRGISVESLRAYQRGLDIPCEELLGVDDAADE